MNFASLLRMHENREQTHYYGNQYAINCNRKNDTSIVYGGHNYSGIKRRTVEPIEPINQTLLEIYSNFEENSHVQWILQLQTQKVKIHKFKPSKIKTKKEELENLEKFQQRPHPQQQRSNITQITKILTEENENDLLYQQDHSIRERKNYSPLNQKRQKNIAQNQNWMENLNQNKFSFGDDSEQVSEAMEEKIHQDQEGIENESNLIENDSQFNTENKSCIEERQEYEVQERKLKGTGVNLMKEFEQFENEMKEIENTEEATKLKENANHPVNEQEQNIKVKVSPCEEARFDPNIGFSFDEIDKIPENQPSSEKKVKNEAVSEPVAERVNEEKESQPTDRNQKFSLSNEPEENDIKQPLENINEKTKETSLTVIKPNVEQEKIENKVENTTVNTVIEPLPSTNSNLREKEQSPHRIYCKASVRNLTPEKFKYPRVESKVESNSAIQPFNTENDKNKNITEKNIKIIDAKIEKVESEKLIIVPNSDRLLALIDESKRLLESKTINEDNRDRVRRIVLHQPSSENTVQLKNGPDTSAGTEISVKENEKKKESEKINNQQIQQKMTTTEQSSKKHSITSQEEVKKVEENSTPQKRELNIPSISSPKSPLQQKPKFFNQLANIETNYTPEKTNLSPYTRYTENIGTQKQTSQFASNVPALNNQPSSIKNTETIIQQNYLQQNNYTYKPLNLPPQPRLSEQKEPSIYKPSTVIYQPNLPPYQHTTQPYQPSVQPYSQFNEVSNIPKPPLQPQMNQNTTVPQTKTYSPYFPMSNANYLKPSGNVQVQENKINQVYQTYTYSGFPSSQQQNGVIRPLSSNETNNYIKITPNYVSPLEKYEKAEQKDVYQLKANGDIAQKENLRPIGLGIEGIKCVESKIYEPNLITNVQSDPKETSIEFSLRIEEHFHLGTK